MGIAERQVLVDIIADRLHQRPARRHVPEQRPRDVGETVGLAVAAAEQKNQRLHRQVFEGVLFCVRGDDVRLAIVVHQEIC